MTVDSVRVRNFQSLRSVDIDLGRLTVIVGPSSSGKSAVIRALRALVSNVRGSDYVSRGEKAAGISARLGTAQISLLRGEGVGKYQVVDLESSQEKTYTKLASGVPEQVTEALNIKPVKDDHSINFAGQFDPPFLLTESGAQVARVLGELTNVSTILEAAREGNRRRNAAQTTLRTRQADLAQLQTRAQEFRTVAIQLARCSEAESMMGQVERLSSQLGRLKTLVVELRVAEDVLTRAVVPTVPSVDAVTQAQERLLQCYTQLSTISVSGNSVKVSSDQMTEAETQSRQWHAALHQMLIDAGTCPTCGQSTSEVSGG